MDRTLDSSTKPRFPVEVLWRSVWLPIPYCLFLPSRNAPKWNAKCWILWLASHSAVTIRDCIPILLVQTAACRARGDIWTINMFIYILIPINAARQQKGTIRHIARSQSGARHDLFLVFSSITKVLGQWQGLHNWCHQNRAQLHQIHLMHTFEIHTYLIGHA